MNSAFASAVNFNHDLAAWNVARVSSMANLFNAASSFNQNLADWNVLQVDAMTGSFDSTPAMDLCYKRGVYDNWGSTLQGAYPSWSSYCTAAPSATPRCGSNVAPNRNALQYRWCSVCYSARPRVDCSTATPSTRSPTTRSPTTLSPTSAYAHCP